MIATVVGDSVYDAWAGMSTQQPQLKANYAARWEAIRWARSLGRTRYDFSGRGEGGVAAFKNLWGGTVAPDPDPFDKFYGLGRDLRRRATGLVWQTKRLRGIVSRIDHRLHSRMAY